MQVALGLLFGYILAASTTDWEGNSYVNTRAISSAPAITFLWTTPFPIGFYAPALLPVIIGFVVSGVETIGDLTATGEASGLEPDSEEQARAVQVSSSSSSSSVEGGVAFALKPPHAALTCVCLLGSDLLSAGGPPRRRGQLLLRRPVLHHAQHNLFPEQRRCLPDPRRLPPRRRRLRWLAAALWNLWQGWSVLHQHPGSRPRRHDDPPLCQHRHVGHQGTPPSPWLPVKQQSNAPCWFLKSQARIAWTRPCVQSSHCCCPIGTVFLRPNQIITSVPMTRRVRFIVSVALAFGLGVTIVPRWTASLLPCDTVTNQALYGLCAGAELTLSTGESPDPSALSCTIH